MRTLTSVIVALIFLASAIDKTFHFSEFVNALGNYVVLPAGFAAYLALPVILAELAVGSVLLVEKTRTMGALAGTLLLGVFTIALSANHVFGDKGICGCWFTFTLASGTSFHIIQNILLIGLLCSLYKKMVRPDAPRQPKTSKGVGTP